MKIPTEINSKIKLIILKIKIINKLGIQITLSLRKIIFSSLK
jgi:hypothetical protein